MANATTPATLAAGCPCSRGFMLKNSRVLSKTAVKVRSRSCGALPLFCRLGQPGGTCPNEQAFLVFRTGCSPSVSGARCHGAAKLSLRRKETSSEVEINETRLYVSSPPYLDLAVVLHTFVWAVMVAISRCLSSD